MTEEMEKLWEISHKSKSLQDTVLLQHYYPEDFRMDNIKEEMASLKNLIDSFLNKEEVQSEHV